jgi:hypothetical protein
LLLLLLLLLLPPLWPLPQEATGPVVPANSTMQRPRARSGTAATQLDQTS